MNVPTQVISPGTLQHAYHSELKLLEERDAVRRLWLKDITLWPGENSAAPIHRESLNWLDLPEGLAGYITKAGEAAAQLKDEFDSVIFTAMGSSNLAAEMVAPLVEAAQGKRFIVLDTVHPEDLLALEEETDIRRSLFLIVNKTGKTLETHTLLLYFLERLRLLGTSDPGRQLIAVTEEHSYLRELATQYQFRHLFLDPGGFPGRFSGLIHFSLLLCALCGRDPGPLIAEVKAMKDACGADKKGSGNGAAGLAALLAAGVREGYERLALFMPKKMGALGDRLGHMAGTSMCKSGSGIVPLAGARTGTMNAQRKNWMAVDFQFPRETGWENEANAEATPLANVPRVVTKLNQIEGLCAEIFRWEIAICLASILLEVDPFSEPDARAARELAVNHLTERPAQEKAEAPKPRITQGEVELYVEGRMRNEISMLSQAEALRSFFRLVDPEGYLAILSFLPRTGKAADSLKKLKDGCESVLQIPVSLNQGPKYLHTLGQCYKGGPRKGSFLMLTENYQRDIKIPGAEYSFGELSQAMALADFQMLVERDRPVLWLHLRKGAAEGWEELQALVEQALFGIRRAKR